VVDYAELKNADPERLTRAAEKAGRVGRDLDQFAEDVLKQGRALGGTWTGKDADAAVQELTRHGRDYTQAHVAYLGVEKAMGTLGQKVTAAKKILDAAEDYAATVPATIDADGRVTAHPPPEARKSDGWMASISQGVKTVAAELQRALDMANAADTEAASALAGLEMPDAPDADPLTALGTMPTGDKATPAAIKKWWDSLSENERELLKNEYPDKVGALDGVPAVDRDDANRILLDERRNGVDEQIKGIEDELTRTPADSPAADYMREKLEKLKQEKDNLDNLRQRLDDPNKKEAFLLKFDPADDGRVILAVGNPDKADNVLTHVPGTGGGFNDGFREDIRRADIEQRDAEAADPSKSTSAIVWQDYDAPGDLLSAGDPSYADDAADDLRDFQHGLRETHEGEPSRNTLLGHSYGSTTVGNAAENANLKIDDLVLVASPGSGQGLGGDAGDFADVGADKGDRSGLTKDHVWAARGNADIIAPISGVPQLGPDPMEDGYGARTFESGTASHTSYWDDDHFRRNLSRIVTGRHDDVQEDVAPIDQIGLPTN